MPVRVHRIDVEAILGGVRRLHRPGVQGRVEVERLGIIILVALHRLAGRAVAAHAVDLQPTSASSLLPPTPKCYTTTHHGGDVERTV